MEINLTTPALLFPAISLILLAFTNRFLGLATVVRNLSRDYRERQTPSLLGQINQLRHRLILIRNMQAFGAASLLMCVVCMFVLFAGLAAVGGIIFAIQSQLGIPVKLVGLGETADDLVPFDADEFVDALFADDGA